MPNNNQFLLSRAECKEKAASAAVVFIKKGMIVGLGTGSTVYYAILKIAELVKKGLKIKAIPTSKESADLAQKNNIPLIDFSETFKIDLTIDGADEVDADFQLIKGGGGALLREKVVASASAEEIIIVDESKLVKNLGKFPLPVEVISFGWQLVEKKITALGANVTLRKNKKSSEIFVTDNGNYILDCDFGKIEKPKELNQTIKQITGVVETGLFIDLATKIVISDKKGIINILSK